MKVLKFGGTSVGSPENIRQVVEIIKQQQQHDRELLIVVSAFAGVTDQLIQLADLAARGDKKYGYLLQDIKDKNKQFAAALIPTQQRAKQNKYLEQVFRELEEVSHGIFLLRELTPRSVDLIMSFGERLSAFTINEYACTIGLRSDYMDARVLLVTNEEFGRATINFQESAEKIKEFWKENSGLKIITGFIAATEKGITTTLGRGGSDLSASIFGAALQAQEVQIWTDVNGVMSADPRKVPDAFSLAALSYEEAMELSHFGARIIHPPTIQPVLERTIPVRILNTFQPDFKGTLIRKKPQPSGSYAKGITSIDNIALLTIKGSGMVGVTGISSRLFSTLARASINVILISQASSEHSICVAVSPENAELAKTRIEKEFALEIKVHMVDRVVIEKELSIIAIVGEHMRHKPGISGRLFNALGEKAINVVAIAQGSSELNISVVVARNDEVRALKTVHEAFFAQRSVMSLFIMGVGRIGAALIKQIQDNYHALLAEEQLELRVVGLANSRRMLIDPEGIGLDNWWENLAQSSLKTDTGQLIKHIESLNLNNSVVVDCTASAEFSNDCPRIMKTGTSLVAANKHATTGADAFYRELHQIAREYKVHFLYETNVGAGLPIISTLRDLMQSGDRIIKIEAVLSGTLSYIFNSFHGERKFSEIVAEAMRKGYTEPDPRTDLSGLDVARKLLILVREIGEKIELEDIQVDQLLPDECQTSAGVEHFFQVLSKQDKNFEKLKKRAEERDSILRYIAIYEKGEARVVLKQVDADHPFYNLKSSDNIVAFTTSRYQDTPLVIRGAGAGAEVTAAGVMADIFKIATAVIKKRSF